MVKLMFFDLRDWEWARGTQRRLTPPVKHPANPLLVSDQPWEGGFMSQYGTVLRRESDGLWQLWYTAHPPEQKLALCYCESDDGISWRRPRLDIGHHDGQPTNIVLCKETHGAAVLYDPADPRPAWRYKLLTGAAPSGKISAFRSADGIHWVSMPRNPVIGSNPDCPIGLTRAADGRYVAYHRPIFGDRRVGRSESWDFQIWSEPKVVIDQQPEDLAQAQFYGMGSIPYGAYELGTLWLFHTREDDFDFHKMRGGHQRCELTYARSGYAWHRAAVGQIWIDTATDPDAWDWGNVQASSRTVLLDDEVRFYYAASRSEHAERNYQRPEPRWGIGLASTKPDRFVAQVAGQDEAQLLSRPFWTKTPEFWVNAKVAADGAFRVGLVDTEGQPIEGFALADAVPLAGDALRHRLTWRGSGDPATLIHRELRFDIRATNAELYSFASGSEAEAKRYWEFRIPSFVDMNREREWTE